MGGGVWGDKAWKLHLMRQTWRRTGTEMHRSDFIWTALLSWITGGISRERKKSRGSDLAQAGLCDGMLYDPVYHALKGGHAGSFEVPDHPAGSLQTCGRWTFMLLAEVIQYLSHLLMCVFWGRDSKKHFYASQSSHEKSSMSGWLALWCFDVGVPLRILSRKK